MTNLPQAALFALLALPFAAATGARAADLDYGYRAPPPPPAYERPVVVEPRIVERPVVVERPVLVERPVVVERPLYPRPYWRGREFGYGPYVGPYRHGYDNGFYGPRFAPRTAYGWRHDRPYGW